MLKQPLFSPAVGLSLAPSPASCVHLLPSEYQMCPRIRRDADPCHSRTLSTPTPSWYSSNKWTYSQCLGADSTEEKSRIVPNYKYLVLFFIWKVSHLLVIYLIGWLCSPACQPYKVCKSRKTDNVGLLLFSPYYRQLFSIRRTLPANGYYR